MGRLYHLRGDATPEARARGPRDLRCRSPSARPARRGVGRDLALEHLETRAGSAPSAPARRRGAARSSARRAAGVAVAVHRAEPAQVGHRHAGLAQAAQDPQPAEVVLVERSDAAGRRGEVAEQAEPVVVADRVDRQPGAVGTPPRWSRRVVVVLTPAVLPARRPPRPPPAISGPCSSAPACSRTCATVRAPGTGSAAGEAPHTYARAPWTSVRPPPVSTSRTESSRASHSSIRPSAKNVQYGVCRRTSDRVEVVGLPVTPAEQPHRQRRTRQQRPARAHSAEPAARRRRAAGRSARPRPRRRAARRHGGDHGRVGRAAAVAEHLARCTSSSNTGNDVLRLRGRGVAGVDQVDVDPVGAQPPQARLAGAARRRPGQVATRRRCGWPRRSRARPW